MEEIMKRQLLIGGRAFTTRSAIKKALSGRKKSFRGSYGVQACVRSSNGDTYKLNIQTVVFQTSLEEI